MSKISVSIVSHGHDIFLENLLNQISLFKEVEEVILTHNLTKSTELRLASSYPFRLIEIQNSDVLGFSNNHNKAFLKSSEKYFCILNPDVVFEENPFPPLLQALKDNKVGLVAPLVLNSEKKIEDSARSFPSISSLVFKLFKKQSLRNVASSSSGCKEVDWLAGMFLLTPRRIFKILNGFDIKFHLYYEDVDLSLRYWKAGMRVCIHNDIHIIHDGQKDSHKKIKFFLMHLKSLLRFFIKHYGRYPKDHKND